MADPHWQSFMEQAVRLLYFLSESPDQLCSRLLQRCSRLLLDQIAEGGEMLANKDVSQFLGVSQHPEEQGEQGERLSDYLESWCTLVKQLLLVV